MKLRILLLLVILLTAVACVQKQNVDLFEEDEEVTLKWMVYGNKSIESDRIFKLFNNKLKEFYPNISVEFEVVAKEDYKDEWDMKMATNEALDIAWIGEELFNYSDEVKKGSFMALDYLLLTYGSELLDGIDEDLWKMQVREGNTFAIPLEGTMFKKELAIITNDLYMQKYEQKDDLQELFLTSQYIEAKHYLALEDYLQYVKEYESLGTGVSYESLRLLVDNGYEGVYGGDSPFVYKIYEDNIIVYNKYELDVYKDYFEAMDRWYKAGYIRSDINEIINPLAEDGKEDGSVLFVAEDGIEGIKSDSITVDYKAYYIPVDQNRYVSYDSCRNTLVIPKSSNNPAQAMELVNLLYSSQGKDLYRLLVNGVENEHYLILNDETIVRMRDNDNQLLYYLPQNSIGSTFQNFELSKEQFYRTRIYNSEAIKSKLIGFDIDTRMIISELTKVEIVVDTYLNLLSQGSEEDWNKTYEEMIQDMNKAGSNKVISELQHQINEFLKEN